MLVTLMIVIIMMMMIIIMIIIIIQAGFDDVLDVSCRRGSPAPPRFSLLGTGWGLDVTASNVQLNCPSLRGLNSRLASQTHLGQVCTPPPV